MAEQLAPGGTSAEAFDFELAEYIDPSWFGLLGGTALFTRVRSVRRARPALSRYLLELLNLSAEPSWTATADPAAIALLSPPVLRAAVLRAGSCCVHPSVRNVVTREQVQRFVDAGGRDLLVFALDRAPRVAADFGVEALAPAEGEAVFEAVRREGMAVLAAATETFPPNVSQRLLLKLPLPWSYGFFSGQPRFGAGLSRDLLMRVTRERVDASTGSEGRQRADG